MSPPRKTIKEYEAESVRMDNGCLLSPRKGGTSIARHVYQLRHGQIRVSTLLVCHTCDTPQCIEDQHHWLGTHRQNMQDAVNKGRTKRSEEMCRAMSTARLGKPHSPHSKETKDKISAALKGVPKTEEHRLKLLGQKRSAETRAKMSKVRRGVPWTENKRNRITEGKAAKRLLQSDL